MDEVECKLRQLLGSKLPAKRWNELLAFAASEGSYTHARTLRNCRPDSMHRPAHHQWQVPTGVLSQQLGAPHAPSTQRMRRKIMPLIKIRGLPLQQEHWLEVLDRKHRYGSDLKVYHEYWLSLPDSDPNFFQWLDGQGASVDLPECSRAKLESTCVKYCSAEEAAQLEVVVDDGGLLRYRLSGELLDTRHGLHASMSEAELAEPTTDELTATGRFSVVYAPTGQDDAPATTPKAPQRSPVSINGLSRHHLEVTQLQGTAACLPEEGEPSGVLESAPSFVLKDDGTTKPKDPYIYVLDTKNRLYVAKKVRGSFHHSSFLRGVPIIAAGGIRVHGGRLLRITAMSGHYKPTQEDIDRLVSVLGGMGVNMGRVTVLRQVKAPKANKTSYLPANASSAQQPTTTTATT